MDPDILLLQETNVLPVHINRLALPPGWAAVFSKLPYKNERGKGAAVVVRCSILPPRGLLRVVLDVSNKYLDAVAVNIRGYLFVSVYLHVNIAGPRAERYTAVYDVLSALDHMAGPVVLTGDFNYPSHQADLLATLSALGFEPACDPRAATHAQGGKLDWVFLRGCRERPRVTVRQQITDHHMLVFQLLQGLPLPPVQPKPRYRRLGKLNAEELAEFHRGLAEVVKDAAGLPGLALTKIREAVPRYCADALGVRRQLRRPPKAWWNRAIEHKLTEYKRAARAHQETQSPHSLERLHRARDDYKREIRRSKTRTTWDAADKVSRGVEPLRILTRGKQAGAHQKLTIRDGESQSFHGFWKSVFADPDPLPPPPRPPPADPGAMAQPDDPLPAPMEQQSSAPAEGDSPGPLYSRLQLLLQKVSASLFTDKDVKAAIRSLQNKAPGEDGIPISVFKGQFKSEEEVVQVVDFYASILADAFNEAIHLGLPLWTKEGVARWLYKGKGPMDNPDNYRLIVLQPILMKILERMVDLRLRELIDQGIVKVSVEQGGFMTHRSTYDSIFLLQSLKDGAKPHKQPLYTAFLDVKKAFDSVSHRRLLRVLVDQGVPEAWVGLVHHLLTDRCTFLGDMDVPIQRGTPQGSPLSPLLFILFMEPLIARLRLGAVGVQLTDKTFITCLLFADDICLMASSLEDLQRMLNICSQWAADMAMVFNAKKSHLLHLSGPAPDANVALLLSGQALEWAMEVTYLGVPLRRTRDPTNKLPLELPRAWASLYRAGAAFNPAVPVPLAAQLQLIVSDVLAGVMYPAAVHDLDYARIDSFVTSLLRRLTGCEVGSSATFLRCETGLMSSKYLAHRRVVQYWRHVNHDAWFAHLLPSFRGQGPRQRLSNVAALYGLSQTTEVDRESGVAYPYSVEQWKQRVHAAVGDAAARHLQAAAAHRQFPEPEVVTKKSTGLLRLVPRPYLLEGGELAKYGVIFRQCAIQGRYREDDPRALRRCHLCHRVETYRDLPHLLTCQGVPESFSNARASLLDRLARPSTQDALQHLRDMSWVAGETGVSRREGLAFMKKAYKLAKSDAM